MQAHPQRHQAAARGAGAGRTAGQRSVPDQAHPVHCDKGRLPECVPGARGVCQLL